MGVFSHLAHCFYYLLCLRLIVLMNPYWQTFSAIKVCKSHCTPPTHQRANKGKVSDKLSCSWSKYLPQLVGSISKLNVSQRSIKAISCHLFAPQSRGWTCPVSSSYLISNESQIQFPEMHGHMQVAESHQLKKKCLIISLKLWQANLVQTRTCPLISTSYLVS